MRSNKKVTKKLEWLGRKIYDMALNTKKLTIFSFFGSPTTKGWRLLVYSVQCTLYNVDCAEYNLKKESGIIKVGLRLVLRCTPFVNSAHWH